MQGWEYVEVAALVGFHVWLRNVAQAVMSVLVHCLSEFAYALTITFLVAYGMLCHIVNNSSSLLFDLLLQTHDAQHLLDWWGVVVELWTTCFSCFKLAELCLAVGTKEISIPVTGPLFQDLSHRFLFSLSMIMCPKKPESDYVHWSKSVAANKHSSSCWAISTLGTNFTTTRLTPRSALTIAWHKLMNISTSLDISVIINLLSLLNKAYTLSVLSLFLLSTVVWDVYCFPQVVILL